MVNCKKIYENEKIIIWEDLKGYDFKYHIENKTYKRIVYYLNGLDSYVVLESNGLLNYFGGEIDGEYIQCFLEEQAEEYSLLNEIRTIQLELENMKNESKEEILKYINYRLFWLKDTIERIGD